MENDKGEIAPFTIRYEGDRRLIAHKVMTTDAGEVTIQHDFPDALQHHYTPGAINEAINLYDGSFEVVGEEGRPYEGQVSFEWYPTPGIHAHGERETNFDDFLDFAKQANEGSDTTWVEMTQIALPPVTDGSLPPQPPVPAASWTRQPLSSYRHDKLGPRIHGDQQNLDRVTFLVPNGWIGMDGLGICDPAEPVATWHGRLQVASGEWEITIDQRRGVGNNDFARSLKQSGGYYITHVGQIRRLDGAAFDYSDIDWILDTLRLTVTLTCGRSINLVLPVGWRGDRAVMADWTARPIDPYRSMSTWRDESIAASQVTRLLECMLDYCHPESRREAIRYAISYYVTANFDLDAELMVAVPLSGLLLLTYFRLVEEQARYTPRQFKKAHTEDLVRELLSDCRVDTSIPGHFAEMAAVAASIALDNPNDPPTDALGVVTFLRNKIMHPAKQKPGAWTIYQWAEAGIASRHFLVMAILHTVGYDGEHHSMLALNRGLGATTPVPWAPSTKGSNP